MALSGRPPTHSRPFISSSCAAARTDALPRGPHRRKFGRRLEAPRPSTLYSTGQGHIPVSDAYSWPQCGAPKL